MKSLPVSLAQELAILKTKIQNFAFSSLNYVPSASFFSSFCTFAIRPEFGIVKKVPIWEKKAMIWTNGEQA
jgi:hypothetical protein